MKITVQKTEQKLEYEVQNCITVLDALRKIKQTQDAALAFRSGCRSGVCGSCAVMLNNKEVLACTTTIEDGDEVAPLRGKVEKDLVIEIQKQLGLTTKAKGYMQVYEKTALTKDDELLNALQSDCILCGACYSACPVVVYNSEFLGPFALTRSWRYLSDKRESNKSSKVSAVNVNGIWDCTLCNECSLVCPQGISSKSDIEKLRMRSVSLGYNDPNAGSFGGFDPFGGVSF